MNPQLAAMYKLQNQQADIMQQAGDKSNYQNDDFTRFSDIKYNAVNASYYDKGLCYSLYKTQ